MRFVIINHGTKEIETFDSAEEMVNRIVKLENYHFLGGNLRPTHLAVDDTGISIIMDFE